MQLQSILTIFALTLSTTSTAIPAPAPEAITAPEKTLEARVTQLKWNAKKDGDICSRSWSGVCYEHCVTEGTAPAKNCIRSTITSAIDGAGCGWLSGKSKCKCVCNKP
ncbi:hypothetical protein ST47_g5872 [Ascochyta rabiei]|uniref:Uncharacterized protein n=1 Tax=Didymella rabiei TaxID=5454 RepID=A0A163D7T6_DIDRA|nr:hypothetical protein ST47_g5872 [Ascochyta rabiei]